MVKKMSTKALENLINSLGGIDEFRKGFERHKRDNEYFDIHSQELLRDYKEEWVAVYNGIVVGHNRDFLKLLNKLSEEEKHSIIRHLTTKKITWILPCKLVEANTLG